jgi:tRNA(Ile2) C34 agmatinyltransferase TiaS
MTKDYDATIKYMEENWRKCPDCGAEVEGNRDSYDCRKCHAHWSYDFLRGYRAGEFDKQQGTTEEEPSGEDPHMDADNVPC